MKEIDGGVVSAYNRYLVGVSAGQWVNDKFYYCGYDKIKK
jgi:hypothetical protein